MQSRIQQLGYRLAEDTRGHLSGQRKRFDNVVTHLETMSSLAILARGYSVTSMSDGAVLRQVKQVKIGDLLTTHPKDGWIESEMKQTTSVKKTWARKLSSAELAE